MVKLITRGIRKLYFHVIKNFSDVITVKTEYGVFKVFTNDKVIGYSLYRNRTWEMQFPEIAFSFLRQNKFIEESWYSSPLYKE